MKARNLFISFFAVLMFCYGGLALAAGDADEQVDQVAIADLQVNINEADQEALAQVLDGVGMSRAAAIVTYREQHGPFYSAEELSAVRGIGIRTVEKNADRIVVN